jgi:hypothetical protein
LYWFARTKNGVLPLPPEIICRPTKNRIAMSSHVSSENKEDSCEEVDIGTHRANVWEIHAVLLIGSCAALVIWARQQYAQQSEGYYSSSQLAIFPMHLKLLVVLAAFAFLQGIIIIGTFYLGEYFGPHEDVIKAVLLALGMALCELLKGTVLTLLLSAGIGRRALKRAMQIGLVFGLISFLITLIYNLSLDDDDEIEGGTDGMSEVQVVELTWQSAILLGYTVLGLAPRGTIKGLNRRPGIIYFSQFWALFHLLVLVSLALQLNGVDAGQCLFQVTNSLMQSLARVWVIYHVFVLEVSFRDAPKA